MPRWETKDLGDGHLRHELDGRRMGAMVDVDPAIRRTVISLALLVDGTDQATVDRCKVRAEQLLATANRGEVR